MKYVSKNYVLYLEDEIKRLQLENDELRAAQAKSLDLMMRGEALRDRMLFNAIINGAFDKK